jgi:hypothetical protein
MSRCDCSTACFDIVDQGVGLNAPKVLRHLTVCRVHGVVERRGVGDVEPKTARRAGDGAERLDRGVNGDRVQSSGTLDNCVELLVLLAAH